MDPRMAITITELRRAEDLRGVAAPRHVPPPRAALLGPLSSRLAHTMRTARSGRTTASGCATC